MKNYLAFYGYEFYPSGGMEDFIGDYDTLQEAIDAINEYNKNEDQGNWENRWAHVYNIPERVIVFQKPSV